MSCGTKILKLFAHVFSLFCSTLLVRVPEDPSKNHGVNVAGGSNPIRRF